MKRKLLSTRDARIREISDLAGDTFDYCNIDPATMRRMVVYVVRLWQSINAASGGRKSRRTLTPEQARAAREGKSLDPACGNCGHRRSDHANGRGACAALCEHTVAMTETGRGFHCCPCRRYRQRKK